MTVGNGTSSCGSATRSGDFASSRGAFSTPAVSDALPRVRLLCCVKFGRRTGTSRLISVRSDHPQRPHTRDRESSSPPESVCTSPLYPLRARAAHTRARTAPVRRDYRAALQHLAATQYAHTPPITGRPCCCTLRAARMHPPSRPTRARSLFTSPLTALPLQTRRQAAQYRAAPEASAP